MDDYQNLFSHAIKIKNTEMLSRRKKFENNPQFIKAGLYYLEKY